MSDSPRPEDPVHLASELAETRYLLAECVAALASTSRALSRLTRILEQQHTRPRHTNALLGDDPFFAMDLRRIQREADSASREAASVGRRMADLLARSPEEPTQKPDAEP